MARITHVKKAQQRYETRPVIDPATGEQKQTPVMRSNGQQKVTKRGKPVFLRVTEADTSRPKPLLSCDFPGCTINDGKIAIGTPYKHITPKSGPFGGRQKNRHAEHPNWQVWEYSSSRSAMVAQAVHSMHETLDSYEFSAYEDFDDLRDTLAEAAGEQRDDAQEALDNMPEGLQEGSRAQENVEALDSWVDEIENCDAPTEPDTECMECSGTGKVDNPEYDSEAEDSDEEEEIDCEDCDGSGEVSSDDVSAEWADEAKDILREAIDGCEI